MSLWSVTCSSCFLSVSIISCVGESGGWRDDVEAVGSSRRGWPDGDVVRMSGGAALRVRKGLDAEADSSCK